MMEKYPTYKPSGVEWIGEIPEHWELIRLKNLNSVSVKETVSKEELDGVDVIHYSIPNVQEFGTGQLEDGSDIDSSKLLVSEGEILFSKLNPRKGTVCIVKEHGENLVVSSGEFISITPKSGNKYYPYYTIGSRTFIEFIDSQVESVTRSHQRVRPDVFLSSSIPLPPLQEQEQIVQYLDEKTEEIDRLVTLTQKKIELLKEKRNSLINHVVTKGLDSDVEMKDSGVEWIGEIPEHWEVKKLKYFVELVTEKGTPKNEDVKISPENVESNTGVCFNYFSDYSGDGFKFKKGDILLNKLRLYLKKILFCESDGYSMGEMIVLRVIDGLNRFFYYTMFHQGLIDELDNQSTGVKLPRVSPEIIVNSFFPFPPAGEQREILVFIENKTEEIDRLVSIEEKRIDTLKEYRQSLISEVVTGKVKVTSV